jgi:hypothetical protein
VASETKELAAEEWAAQVTLFCRLLAVFGRAQYIDEGGKDGIASCNNRIVCCFQEAKARKVDKNKLQALEVSGLVEFTPEHAKCATFPFCLHRCPTWVVAASENWAKELTMPFGHYEDPVIGHQIGSRCPILHAN